jgi:hypothetical protein
MLPSGRATVTVASRHRRSLLREGRRCGTAPPVHEHASIACDERVEPRPSRLELSLRCSSRGCGHEREKARESRYRPAKILED